MKPSGYRAILDRSETNAFQWRFTGSTDPRTNRRMFQVSIIRSLQRAVLSAVLAHFLVFNQYAFADPETPTHAESQMITFDIGESGRLETMAMTPQGEILASVTWLVKKPDATGEEPKTTDDDFWDYWSERREIRVLDQTGKQQRKIDIQEVVPLQICAAEDGTIFVGGEHRIAVIGRDGKIRQKVKIVDIIPDTNDDTHVSGVAISDRFIFVAIGTGRSLRATEDIVRLTRDLKDPQLIIERQFGCCSHIDMAVFGDELLVAENSRHRVNRFSFDGELLGRWGKRERTDITGFGACCNPVNFDLIGNTLVTAESGIGRIKAYSPDGQFKQLIGYVDTTKFDKGSRIAAASCYIPVEVAPNGKRIFVMDVRANAIRVLEKKQ